MNTYKTVKFDMDGRQYRRTECYDKDGLLFRVYFERFVPETSVRLGLGRYSDRHACWRLVSSRHHKLRNRLLTASGSAEVH
jgi:hypothetical protein